MGLAASSGVYSSLTVKRATGMCCSIHMGSVVWIWPCSSHASELAKPCLQESVGVRQLQAAPRWSQPAVKQFLIDREEGRTNRAVLDIHCISSHMGFEDIKFTQSWRRHNPHKTYGSEVRHTSRCHQHQCSFKWPMLLDKLMQPFWMCHQNTRLTAHPHKPASCKLQTAWLQKFHHFPFPHNIWFWGDICLPHSCSTHGRPWTWASSVPQGLLSPHSSYLAHGTSRALWRTKEVHGCLLTNF